MSTGLSDLERFVRGEVDPATFPHREHVRMAFELLRRHDFAEVVLHYSRALRAMTARIGKPQVFNQTVTIAFLGLIAERMGADCAGDFASFEHGNPEVFDKSVLRRWYPPERLASELARRAFLLPEPLGPAAPQEP
jgi:hypothetical protein